MKKSVTITLGVLASVAISACSDNNATASRECVNSSDSTVVNRDWCTQGNPHYAPMYAWYYGGSLYRRGAATYVRAGSFTASRAFSHPSPTVSRGVIGGEHSSAHAAS